jgi:hypothetical protein
VPIPWKDSGEDVFAYGHFNATSIRRWLGTWPADFQTVERRKLLLESLGLPERLAGEARCGLVGPVE